MSETTAEDTTEGTGSVELRGVHLDLARFAGCRNKEALVGNIAAAAFWNSSSSKGFGSERRCRVEKAWKKRLTAGVLHDGAERSEARMGK